MKKILLILTLFITVSSFSQISGVVVDTNEKPLEGVNILIKGTQKGTQTEQNGNFKITDIKGSQVLIISHVGYKRQQINVIAPKNNLKVVLISKNNTLGEVTVVGQHNRTNVTSAALRLQTPIKELPQNIQVVSNEILQSQMVTNMLEGAFRNVSGVSNIEHWGHFARLNMRGFRLPAFRNGVNIQDSWGPLSEDMFMVDRIEFVKGPSGFMMAAGEPGGFYNVVTKKPTAEKIATVSLMAGSFDTYRGAVDLGGSLTNDKRLLSRVNIMYQNTGNHRDFETSERFGIAPSLSYKITDKTTALAEFSFQELNTLIGSAYTFGPASRGYASLDRDFSMVDSNFPETDIEEVSFLGQVTHQFNDNWSIEAKYVTMNYNQVGASAWLVFGTSVEENGDTRRRISIWDAISEGEYFQTYINGKFSTGGLKHKILGGFDFTEKEYWADFSQGGSPDVFQTFNIFNPTYGDREIPTFDRSVALKDRPNVYRYGTNIRSFYLQDEISFLEDKVRLTLAGRHTQLTPLNKETINKFTPRVGLSVDVLPQLTVYGLYDQSFLPSQPPRDATLVKPGVDFDPVEGTIFEGGIKSKLFNDKLTASLSAYQIVKNNLPLPSTEEIIDPNTGVGTGRFYVLPDEEVTSKGFEVDLQGKITNELSLILNYANTNVENSGGTRIAGHSKHISNGWLTYDFNENSFLKGFGVSLGYQYQVDRSSWSWNADNKTDLPDYFRMDGAISWKNDKWRVGLNINNILNEYLYSGANYGAYLYWQTEPGLNGRISVTYSL